MRRGMHSCPEVMRGFDPRVHLPRKNALAKGLKRRAKPGHDAHTWTCDERR
jgi:hypothetical protein